MGCAARGGPRGQRKTLRDAKLEPEKRVWERKKPLTRPATAGESALAGHPLPKGEGYIPDLGIPGVQPKMWVTISYQGEELRAAFRDGETCRALMGTPRRYEKVCLAVAS